MNYPFRPGYSIVGRVIGVGKGVSGIREGDRIASYGTHQQFYKIQLYGLEKRYDIPRGAVAAYVLPDHISSEDGAWRSLAVTCPECRAPRHVPVSQTACVVAWVSWAELVTRSLAATGARRIIVIDTAARRLELAKQNGATHTLQVDVRNAAEAINDITNGWLCDVVFDITGHPSALAPCIQLVRRYGRLVLLGDTPTPSEQHLGTGDIQSDLDPRYSWLSLSPNERRSSRPGQMEVMSGRILRLSGARQNGCIGAGHASLFAARSPRSLPKILERSFIGARRDYRLDVALFAAEQGSYIERVRMAIRAL